MSDFDNEIMDWTDHQIKPTKPWPPPPPRPPEIVSKSQDKRVSTMMEERYRWRKYPDELPPIDGKHYIVRTRSYQGQSKKNMNIFMWSPTSWIKESVWDNDVIEWTNIPPEREETNAVDAR